MRTLTIRQPDDFHLHLRQGDILRRVLRYSADVFARAVVMPNTVPPILEWSDAMLYRDEIRLITQVFEADEQLPLNLRRFAKFQPLMAIKLTPETTPEVIRAAADVAVAAKLYPDGVTTNSAGGVRDFDDLTDLYPTFEAMEEAGMVLCIHGELPGVDIMRRERLFLPVLQTLAGSFPTLRIVLEHISNALTVGVVEELPKNVAATITAHHLVLTLDDVIGDAGLQPHHYCKPIAKTKYDRHTLVQAATSGNPKFFFGSDSAPHELGNKECNHGAAGVFSAPVAMPLLAQVFDVAGALDKLEDFTSRFGAEFYGLELNQDTIMLAEEPWQVPDYFHAIVPLWAGKQLNWRVV